MSRRGFIFSILYSLSAILVLCSGGCMYIGAAAGKLAPPETIHAKYVGLVGQSVGVMVWTDRGIQTDYPSLAMDLANAIQNKLMAQTKRDELKHATFPVRPASIVRYQQDHPNLDFKNLAEVAPKFGVTRLVYVEVEDFGTRAPASVELFRGSMTVSVQVAEINGDKTTIPYEENDVKAVYPPKVPEDGTPSGDDYRFYLGTIDAMATEVSWKLVSHEEEF